MKAQQFNVGEVVKCHRPNEFRLCDREVAVKVVAVRGASVVAVDGRGCERVFTVRHDGKHVAPRATNKPSMPDFIWK